MHSKFDNPLELSSDQKTIYATGPLSWDPGDADHCEISVTMTQGTHVGHGHTGNYNHDECRWKCDVKRDDGGKWNVADVLAHGDIHMSDPPPALPWPDQTVSLVLQTAAAPQA